MLVAAAVLPHGDFVYDPSLIKDDVKARAEAEKLNVAAQETAAALLSLDIDLIVLVTPHGLSVEDDVGAYLGQRGSGYAEVGRDVGDPSVDPYLVPFANLTLDNSGTKEMWQALQQEHCSITGITSFGGYDDVPLRYGEIIPLSFFRSSQSTKETVRNEPVCTILSLPNKRYTQGPMMVQDMLSFGAKLYQHVENIQTKRIAIIVSADLAHTHEASGPYGFSPAAAPFDRCCSQWASTLDGKSLLDTAKGLLEDAKSCGYLGLVILHGILSENINDWDRTNNLRAVSHPTY